MEEAEAAAALLMLWCCPASWLMMLKVTVSYFHHKSVL